MKCIIVVMAENKLWCHSCDAIELFSSLIIITKCACKPKLVIPKY